LAQEPDADLIKENKRDEARFQAKWRRPNEWMQLTGQAFQSTGKKN